MSKSIREPRFVFRADPQSKGALHKLAYADQPDPLPTPAGFNPSGWAGQVFPCPFDYPHASCRKNGKECRGWHGYTFTAQLIGHPDFETWGHGSRELAALALWKRRRSWELERQAREADLIPHEVLWQCDPVWAAEQVREIGRTRGDVPTGWGWLVHACKGDEMAALGHLSRAIGKIDDTLNFTGTFGITVNGSAVSYRNVCGTSIWVDGEKLLIQDLNRSLHRPEVSGHRIYWTKQFNTLHARVVMDDTGRSWGVGFESGQPIAWPEN